MIKIDGVEFAKAVVELNRSFSVVDTANTKRVIAGDMIRDVVGTYYNYSAVLDTSFITLQEYDELYEIITSPDTFHVMEVPYGQTTYVYQAYITNGSDKLIIAKSEGNQWNNLTFNFIAKSPKRRPG